MTMEASSGLQAGHHSIDAGGVLDIVRDQQTGSDRRPDAGGARRAMATLYLEPEPCRTARRGCSSNAGGAAL